MSDPRRFPGGAGMSPERVQYINTYLVVRDYVLLRDNYVCQKCHMKGYRNNKHGEGLKLTTHHLKPICHGGSKLDPNNQIAIHLACHREIQP